MVKHLPYLSDHTRDQESGSVKRTKAKTPSLDGLHDAESSGRDESSSGFIFSLRESRVGKDFSAPKGA